MSICGIMKGFSLVKFWINIVVRMSQPLSHENFRSGKIWIYTYLVLCISRPRNLLVGLLLDWLKHITCLFNRKWIRHGSPAECRRNSNCSIESLVWAKEIFQLLINRTGRSTNICNTSLTCSINSFVWQWIPLLL